MKKIVSACLAVLALPGIALAITLFSSQYGDVNFPGLKGSAAGSVNTPVTAYPLQVDGAAIRTATATAGAATLNTGSGTVTSESLTTAAAATYTLTVTDSDVAATDIVHAAVYLGTATTGVPVVSTVTPGPGSFVVVVQNNAASAAFNGTIKINFVDLK